MKRPTKLARRVRRGRNLPVLIEKGQDGYYVVECPVFDGCYSQGRTIDEALRNIREVIALVLEEKEARQLLRNYRPQEISLLTLSV